MLQGIRSHKLIERFWASGNSHEGINPLGLDPSELPLSGSGSNDILSYRILTARHVNQMELENGHFQSIKTGWGRRTFVAVL